MLEILLLGPVEAWAGVVRVPLAPLERDLLALLALQPGTTSSTDRIIDGLWGERPPAAPRARVQGLVSTLRRKVGDALVTRQPGYLLDLPPEATDLGRCEDFARRARSGRDAAETAEWLRRALGLWRGEALEGVSAPGTDPERARLSELRIGLLERCFETELALGRHAEVVGELAAAVSANPLRERLVLHLMAALYRCSRQADAMRAYQALQERLDEELGAEPCPELRELRALILRGEPLPGLPVTEGPRVTLPGPRSAADDEGVTAGAEASEAAGPEGAEPAGRRSAADPVPADAEALHRSGRDGTESSPAAAADRADQSPPAIGDGPDDTAADANGDEASREEPLAATGPTHAADPAPASIRLAPGTAGSAAHHAADPGALPRPGHTGAAAAPVPRPAPAWAAAPATPPPAQTPATSGHFIGRDDDLAALTAALPGPADEPRVLVVTGAGGLGKTALVVRWAHSVADRFPDGQIFVDLRSAGPSGPPQAGSALGAVLLALGVATDRLPVSVEERAALYRTLVHAKRVLLIADDVRAVGQLLPLVPPTPGSLIVATSRRKLTALSIHHAVRTLTLEPLAPAAAQQVLRAIVGPDRPLGAGTEEVVELCGGWPLALRIAGATLAARSQSPASFAEELRERVDTMAVSGDPRTVREALVEAHAGLDPAAARLFGQLGLMPGSSVGLRLAAAAAGVSVLRARQLLDELISANLVVETGPDRYGFHAMVLRFARLCGAGLPDRTVVEERVIRWYLRVFEVCAAGGRGAAPLPGPATGPGTAQAPGIVFDGPAPRPAVPPAPVSQPRRPDPAAVPDAWMPAGEAEVALFLDFERPELPALAAWVAGRGDPALTWRFVAGAHTADPLLALETRLLGLAAAGTLDDLEALGTAHALVGAALLADPARHQEADRHLTLAAGLLARTPERFPAPAAFGLGALRLSQGRAAEAAQVLELALRALDPGREPMSYAVALLAHARVLRRGGATRRARERLAQALILCEASSGVHVPEPRTAAEALEAVEAALAAPRVGGADRALARAMIAVGRALAAPERGGAAPPGAAAPGETVHPGTALQSEAEALRTGAVLPTAPAGPSVPTLPAGSAETGRWVAAAPAGHRGLPRVGRGPGRMPPARI